MVLTIAEIGINHNGSLDLAKKTIDIAVDAGCSAVKFQKRSPDICVPEDQKQLMREWDGKIMTYLEYKKLIEFEKAEYDEIDRYCKDKKIEWFASAWDLESQKFLQQYNLKYNKIASAMLTNELLLKTVAQEGRHCFVSTGMSTLEEITKAVSIFELYNCPYTLMACTSTYPCLPEECNVSRVNTLQKLFPGSLGVGYSSHSAGILAPTLAVALGASVIEVHISSSRYLPGTDQSASLEKHGIELLMRDIANIPKMLGNGSVGLFDSEIPIKLKLRKC